MLVAGKFAWVLQVKLHVNYPLYSGKFTCGCRHFPCFLREVLAAQTRVNLPVFTGKLRLTYVNMQSAGKVTCICMYFRTRQFYNASCKIDCSHSIEWSLLTETWQFASVERSSTSFCEHLSRHEMIFRFTRLSSVVLCSQVVWVTFSNKK